MRIFVTPLQVLIVFLIGVSLLTGTRAAYSQTEPSMPPQSVRVDDSRFTAVAGLIRAEVQKSTVPSVSVSVAEHGKIVWEASFGWADPEKKVPAAPDTVYALASATKPLTATAVMVLAQRGAIDVEGPVTATGLPFQLRALDKSWPEARVRNLLNHTSGLPTYFNLFFPDEAIPLRPLDESVRRYGILVYPPGSQFEYSNLGYGILDHVVARASGQTFGRFMQDAVFAPLGMEHTSIGPPTDPSRTIATAYDAQLKKPLPHFFSDTVGADEAYSTAHDMAIFAMLHLKDQAAGRKTILSAESIDQMQQGFEAHATYHYYGGARYGFGWFLSDERPGYKTVWHNGGAPGASTSIKLVPEKDVAVVVLMNTFNQELCSLLTDSLLHAVLPEQPAHSAGEAASYKPYAPEAVWLGKWSGELETPEAKIPFEMTFQPDGDVHVNFPDYGLKSFLTGQSPVPHAVLLNFAGMDDDQLIGIVGGRLPSADLSRSMDHLNKLTLVRKGDFLRGFVTALAADERERYAFSFPVTLKKMPEAK